MCRRGCVFVCYRAPYQTGEQVPGRETTETKTKEGTGIHLAPTRELADQIYTEAKRKKYDPRATCVRVSKVPRRS